VNESQTTSFAEQASTWLFGFEFVVYVATGVVILFYQFPAYKRFRTRALLLLVISSALTVFVTIFDHTIGQKGPPDPNDWWQYYFCREVVWMAAIVLGTVGTLMFLRDYTQLAAAATDSTAPNAASQHDRNAS
jgi:predicted membrane channel-forming protein YqfA (hemolysin III family)